VKNLLLPATRLVEVIALAASAGSVMFILDGPLAWVTATVVFAVVALLWRAAMCARAPWPLPTAWHYACKAALYLFAAEVVWAAAEWAGPVFLIAALSVEFAAVHSRGLAGAHREHAGPVSRGVGRVA
jgi:hypothetical protein